MIDRAQTNVVLYAPNVHNGGGWVLLQALLAAWPADQPLTAFLDARVRPRIRTEGWSVRWVKPRVLDRLAAEVALQRAAKSARMVFCFHGLPPLLPGSAPVIVFLQNRLYVDGTSLSGFVWKTRIRLTVERVLARALRARVHQYIVQTPSMKRAVLEWYAGSSGESPAKVNVLPFVDALPGSPGNSPNERRWDFVYVAHGESHKNHSVLLAAWLELARDGLRPSLVLTLGSRDEGLVREIVDASKQADLRIHNAGELPWNEVAALYKDARALIFPSISESFGLPLIEAAQTGLPIVAAEKDYVRDVCTPAQTFDPQSPTSIARAVKRFLNVREEPPVLRSAAEFWTELLKIEG